MYNQQKDVYKYQKISKSKEKKRMNENNYKSRIRNTFPRNLKGFDTIEEMLFHADLLGFYTMESLGSTRRKVFQIYKRLLCYQFRLTLFHIL